MKPLLDRLIAKIDFGAPEGCWLWTGGVSSGGYGLITRGRRDEGQALTHRVSYELLIGPIPAGLELDHLCYRPRCVNPYHLEPVTHAENARRRSARTTHCPQGHPYDEKNTYRSSDGTKRGCRACRKAASLRWQRRQKGRQ